MLSGNTYFDGFRLFFQYLPYFLVYQEDFYMKRLT